MLNEKEKEEEKRQLVIARLETLNPDAKILLMEKEPITVRDMIKEVKENSKLGKIIIEVQFSYMKMLTSGGIDR